MVRKISKLAGDFLNIAFGAEFGYTPVHVFGINPTIDSGQTFDLWDGGAGADYTFSSAAVLHFISSSDNGDTQEYKVIGLNANFDQIELTITLVGQTKTQIGTGETFIRILSVENMGSTDNAGIVFVYENDTVTAGTPDTATLIRAQIAVGNNKSRMAIYTVPNNKIAIIVSLFASLASATSNATSIITPRERINGGVFKAAEVFAISTTGTDYVNHNVLVPEPVVEKTDIVLRASSDTNGLAVGGGFNLILANADLIN